MRRGKSLVLKRSIKLDGHKTSVSIEDAFWTAFKEIAAAQGTSVERLAAAIDNERHKNPPTNLSSAIRLFVLDYYRRRMPLMARTGRRPALGGNKGAPGCVTLTGE
jgi:predicted DNA-binding ribbon-helix-helix protein